MHLSFFNNLLCTLGISPLHSSFNRSVNLSKSSLDLLTWPSSWKSFCWNREIPILSVFMEIYHHPSRQNKSFLNVCESFRDENALHVMIAVFIWHSLNRCIYCNNSNPETLLLLLGLITHNSGKEFSQVFKVPLSILSTRSLDYAASRYSTLLLTLS